MSAPDSGGDEVLPVFMAVNCDNEEPEAALLIDGRSMLFIGEGGLDAIAFLINTRIDGKRKVVTGCSKTSTPWYAVMMSSVTGDDGESPGLAIQKRACGDASVDILYDFVVANGFHAPLESLLPIGTKAAVTAEETCAQLEQAWRLAGRQGYLGRQSASGKIINWPLCGNRVHTHSSGQTVVERRFRSVADCLQLLSTHPPDQSWQSDDIAVDVHSIYWGVHEMGPPRSTASPSPPSSPA
jgi:hypothetical protein